MTLFSLLIASGLGSWLSARAAARRNRALAALLLAPLGLCLGAFLPLGLDTVSTLSERRREVVAWSWAVNGFFSVVSSVLATILSMTLGFRMLLVVALLVYAIGAAAFSRVPEPRSHSR